MKPLPVMHRRYPWEVEDTEARLLWLYGPERAAAIKAGTDEATNADLAAWRKLGRRASDAA